MTLVLRRLLCHCVTAKQAEILSPVPSWENQPSINTWDPNSSCPRSRLLHSTSIPSLLSSLHSMLKDTWLTERSGLRMKWFQSHVPGTVHWSKAVCGVRISYTAEIFLTLLAFFFFFILKVHFFFFLHCLCSLNFLNSLHVVVVNTISHDWKPYNVCFLGHLMSMKHSVLCLWFMSN